MSFCRARPRYRLSLKWPLLRMVTIASAVIARPFVEARLELDPEGASVFQLPLTYYAIFIRHRGGADYNCAVP